LNLSVRKRALGPGLPITLELNMKMSLCKMSLCVGEGVWGLRPQDCFLGLGGLRPQTPYTGGKQQGYHLNLA
jgi:hypothetical protein